MHSPNLMEDGKFSFNGLPAYWDNFRRAGHCVPEQDLMLALLKDALLNYRKFLKTRNRRYREDREWFFAPDSDRLFSFASVCAVLGLSAAAIRRRLLEWERGLAGPVSVKPLDDDIAWGKVIRLRASAGR